MNTWPPPPRRDRPQAPTPSLLRPLRPLALTVAGCYGGVYLLFLLPMAWRVIPRWFAHVASIAYLVLLNLGYILSLVLGVLFVRRIARSAVEAIVLYVLLALYALGFPPFAFMGANYAGL